MAKIDDLLCEIAKEYYIRRGTSETEKEWLTRIVYSICGMMAYSSLWDTTTEEQTSIVHLKKKIRHILSSYKALYPALSINLPFISEELEDEIQTLFEQTGIVYHRSNWIAPSMMRKVPFDGISFQRGVSIDSIPFVSGIGYYSLVNESESIKALQQMFGLEQQSLLDVWQFSISEASWIARNFTDTNIEYLRLEPPFEQSYWVNRPNTSGTISMLRIGQPGARTYYLYRYSGTSCEVSHLPGWRVDEHNYRTISSACLSAHGTLPPIEYDEDGPLIHIHLAYLLPPRELNFLKLYSWPEECTSLPCDFRRKLSKEVFNTIKSVLIEEGYEFTRRKL